MLIPRGQRLLITTDTEQNSVIGNAQLLLEDDVTLNISSDFDNLIANGGGNALASALTTLFTPLSNIGLSGQFKQQGFQVWKSTQPIEMSFNCHLRMKTSGKRDVYEPTIAICKLAVPSEGTFGLTPPGPSIKYALEELAQKLVDSDNSFSEGVGTTIQSGINYASSTGRLSSGETTTISVGNYLSLSPVIVTRAVPVFSKETDTDGYPISCRLQIDIRTANITTKEMLEEMDDFNTTASELTQGGGFVL